MFAGGGDRIGEGGENMKKDNKGCGCWVIVVLFTIALPFIAVYCLSNRWAFIAVVSIIGGWILGLNINWKVAKRRGESLATIQETIKYGVPCMATIACALSLVFWIAQPKTEQHKEEYTVEYEYEDNSWDSVVRTAEIAAYYQDYYPMVWGYIKKNADSPYDYIEFYDSVWGDLQEYTGDGINFDTLTRYEQSLVNYPRIGSRVYFSSSTSKEYHSTNMCYSLLKSNPISRPASQRYSYNPCSKCVGD